jgi:hypothetical protein
VTSTGWWQKWHGRPARAWALTLGTRTWSQRLDDLPAEALAISVVRDHSEDQGRTLDQKDHHSEDWHARLLTQRAGGLSGTPALR